MCASVGLGVKEQTSSCVNDYAVRMLMCQELFMISLVVCVDQLMEIIIERFMDLVSYDLGGGSTDLGSRIPTY